MQIVQNAKINTALAHEMVVNGRTLPEAFDAVLGVGAYQQLAGQLYDALRAKAGK